jgi:DNA primase
MDVMQAQQAGFANVVAQMGTALTEPQLRQLQRYTQRLVLALDPDTAGIQATLRGVEVAKEVLEQEWEPVFDPRGLVGYEARLGAEIRVLQLPRGQDPDDLIREKPERWAELVEGAVPVVDFYLQVLMEPIDPDDTKAKAHVVDALLPVLRTVANPVEREDFVQKIARVLRVDPRAVQSRLRAGGRRWGQPQRSAGSEAGRHPENGAKAEADLEGYCLSALLERPGILLQINEALRQSELEPLTGQDFQNAGYRAAFELWAEILASEETDPVEALYADLPTAVHARLEELRATNALDLADDQLMRDITVTLMRMRERNLKRLGRELGFLMLEAQESGDLRAEQYIGALRSYTDRLRRTQHALAQRWGWANQG